MTNRDKYFPASVSRYLSPGETGFRDVVYQKGKLVLDSELLLQQDLQSLDAIRQLARTCPSGWVRGQHRGDNYEDFSYDVPWLAGPTLNPDFVANSFWMSKCQALVAGMLLDIEYTNTDEAGRNRIILDPATEFAGTLDTFKRTDFVWLEVWLAVVSESPNAKGTFVVSELNPPSAGDTITVDGVTFTGVLIPPGPNQFRIFPSSPTQTAQSIADQITALPVASVRTVANANIVQITAAQSGVVGNAIAIVSSNPTAITASGPLLTGGADTPNKPSQDKIYRHGNVLSSVAVALDDDIEDPDVGVETTKRVQVQYRIRHTGESEALEFKTECDGFSNSNVLAQGGQSAPVVGYSYVPADNKSIVGSSDATAYGLIDNGLYIAGDGSEASATALQTLDGFVYAIPLSFVFRRNDSTGGAGWEPESNTNGGLNHDHPDGFVNPNVYSPVATGESDRPDGIFVDQIVDNDLLDLRRSVRLTGVDMSAELQYQMQALQDGTVRTWAIDTASKQELGGGTGDVSTRPLICNEIGRLAADGGNPPLSGDTSRGETIRNFDLVCRRFGDQPVVERVVLVLSPGSDIGTNPGLYVERASYAGGFSGWAEGDILHLDLTNLNVSTLADFSAATSTYVPAIFSDLVPAGTTITDVLSIFHDDGNYTTAVDQRAQASLIQGVGTTELTVTLDSNVTQMTGGVNVASYDAVGTNATGDVGSPRPIFLEVEITYPLGAGLTDTPDFEVVGDNNQYPFGAMLENDLPAGSTQRPGDMETPLAPSFRQGFRETMVEYVANDPNGGVGNPGAPIGSVGTVTVVSRDPLQVVFPRRFFGDGTKVATVTDTVDAVTRVVDDPNTDYGSSTREVNLENTGLSPSIPLSGAGQTLVEIEYFGQDPVPNYGPAGAGYQQAVYFRTAAPQTCGTKEGIVSSGLLEFPYNGANGPMPNPLQVEPIYVSDKVWSGQVGMGSTELPFPHFAPLDQIPVNDGRTFNPPSLPADWFEGEHEFAASALISIDGFDANVGTISLNALVPAEGSIGWEIGGPNTDEEPFKDSEFRAAYPIINKNGHRPTVMTQGLSGVTRHKVWTPVLARSLQDSPLFRKDEVLLLVISRWARLDSENVLTFDESSDSTTAVGVYRTKNLSLTVGR